MIIYGSKAVHLKTAISKTAICPSCGTKGSLAFSVFRKHLHIFWIPLFPIGKKGVSQCQHCKNVLETKEMPEQIKREYDDLKHETEGPIWQFAGLMLIAILIALGYYASGEDKKQEIKYLANPQKGDIYKYKTETASYSTLKVAKVTNDSVFVFANEYEISKMRKIYKITKPENYSDLSYGISKTKLNDMYNSGEIFDINRK